MKRETQAVRSARMTWIRCINHYGREDPRTVAAKLELAQAKAKAAQDEADRLRAIADSLAVAS